MYLQSPQVRWFFRIVLTVISTLLVTSCGETLTPAISSNQEATPPHSAPTSALTSPSTSTGNARTVFLIMHEIAS